MGLNANHWEDVRPSVRWQDVWIYFIQLCVTVLYIFIKQSWRLITGLQLTAWIKRFKRKSFTGHLKDLDTISEPLMTLGDNVPLPMVY